MRRILASLAAIALVPAMPLMAQGISATHAEHAGLAGKTPTKAYRPLNQSRGCRTATNHHQTGKIPMTPQVPVSSSCQAELAARDSAERKN